MLTGDGEAKRTAETERAPRPAHRHKLLFLLPFAPDLRGSHGGSRATAEIIEALSKSHRVCVLYLSADGDPPPRQLPRNCERLVAVPVERPAPTRHASLKQLVGWQRPRWVEESWSLIMANQAAAAAAEFEPDIVHHEFHVMAQYVPVIRTAFPPAACIVTEHEPGITADARPGVSLTLRQRLGALARHRAWSRYERAALSMADAIIVFTASDAAALERLLGPGSPPISVIPLRIAEHAASLKGDVELIRSDFLFVGNFRHPPNADAARRLVCSIFPMILHKLPSATLTIVGADPPNDLVNAASNRVTVTGWVDDPSIYLAGATIVLVPLRQGGGLRVKMLEACAAGKAIVASRTSVEGLSLTHGKEVMLAETDEEFAKSAVDLMADTEARALLEASSRRWWENEHDPARWSEQYAALYATLARSSDHSDVCIPPEKAR